MFDFKKEKNFSKNINQEQEKTDLDKNMPLSKEQIFNAHDVRVHVMPEKFLSGNIKKIATVNNTSSGNSLGATSSHKKTIIWGIIIGFLVISLMALGAWFLIKSIEQPAPNNEPIKQEKQVQQEQNNVVPEEEANVNACSPQNCVACTVLECQNLSASCHVADSCLITGSNSLANSEKSACPNFVCLTGAEVEEKDQPEKDSDQIKLTSARDSDNDMLTDTEEGLWATNPLKEDSDGDNYFDGQEIVNLYSPVINGSSDNAKLIGSNLVKEYVNNKFGYAIYYPTSWIQEDLKKNNEEIVFKAGNDEFVEILVSELEEEDLTAKEWYLSQDDSITEKDLKEVLIGNWSGVRSLDGLSVYLVRNNKLYTLTYNVGLNTELTYQTTFEMMLKTFKFFESPLN